MIFKSIKQYLPEQFRDIIISEVDRSGEIRCIARGIYTNKGFGMSTVGIETEVRTGVYLGFNVTHWCYVEELKVHK